jgi:hypothetical protein
MPRFALALALSWIALQASAAAGQSVGTAANDLSGCLDASTTLLAGGDVGDRELVAAQQTCARLKKASSDSHTIARIDAAAETIAEEIQRRKIPRQ